MASKREQILAALFTALGGVLSPRLLRNENLPANVPQGGIMILRDGDPGEPEILLSPPLYVYEHRAALEIVVEAGTAEARDTIYDDLMLAIGAVINGNRTLYGFCDYIEAEAPAPLDLAVEGAPGLKAAVLGIILHYALDDPLSHGGSGPSPIEPGEESLDHLFAAGQNISALRVIARNDAGLAIYADKNNAETIRAIAGISRNSAAPGDPVQVTTMGIIEDSLWNWNMNADPSLFLGLNGAISQGPTPGNSTVRIGVAIAPKTVLVRLGEPVINA